MKRNAIVRIVIYSVLILLLLGILAAGMELVATDIGIATADSENSEYFDTNIPADQVHFIDIDWAAGDIVIKSGDVDSIIVEESKSDSQKPMVVKVKNGNLEIEFHEGELNIGFGINVDAHKDLTITVPKDHSLREIELDIASAEVEIRDLAGTVDEIDIDAASGPCTIENCTVRTLDVDTASGDVSFRGSLDSLNFDAASAEFVGVFTNNPRNLKLDSMSGDMEITLPAGCGFTATVDALSSRFVPDQDFNLVNGAYVHGDGSCRIDVSGMSGDVKIHQGK